MHKGGADILGNISIPTGAISGIATVIKTVINCSTVASELNISGASNLGSSNINNYGIDKLVINKTHSTPSDDVSHRCIYISENSSLYCGPHVGVCGGYYGIRCQDGSLVNAQNVHVTGCSFGIVSTNGSSLIYTGVVVSGCTYGVFVARLANAHYNLTDGSSFYNNQIIVCCGKGICSWYSGDIMDVKTHINNCCIGIHSFMASSIYTINSKIYYCSVGERSNVNSCMVTSSTRINNCTHAVHAEQHSYANGVASAISAGHFTSNGTNSLPSAGAAETSDGTYIM